MPKSGTGKTEITGRSMEKERDTGAGKGRTIRRKKAGRLAAASLLVVICCLIWQQSKKAGETSCTKQLFAMDTVMSFAAYGKNSEAAVDAAIEEVKRLDRLLSTGNGSSEISALNEKGEGEVSADTAALFRRGLEIYEDTGGAFDFTIYPLMRLWGFPTKEYHVPEDGELREILPLVDASKISLSGNEVRLGLGQQVDFGGIAKGYTSARVMEIYEEHGITSGMVSLGGNVQVLGIKPDGTAWRVGIQDPEGDQGESVAVLQAKDCAVVTSGGYERYFEEDGNTYIHILDPETGRPAQGDLASVTVVSEDGTLADALSTSLYIMGFEEAVSYWRDREDAFDLILIAEDGKIYATEGLSDRLESRGCEITILYGEEG